jgi:valyl-tRNA synthetase
MGITNCADEWQGYLAEDVQVAAQRLYPDTLRILKHAKNLVITTTAAADELADIAASELHPLISHRGRRLIDHLIASGWHRSGQKAAGAGRQTLFVPALHEPEIRLRWRAPALAEPRRTEEPRKTVAAAPISTASRPSVDSLLPAVLADVRARSVEAAGEGPCRRVLGADHGGLNLQLAVERSLPYDREEVGRDDFVEACLDLHHRNDAAAREQLKQLGALFEPSRWLDPMSPQGQDAVQRLFHAVEDAGLLERQQHLAHHCPRCSTVLVASDVRRTRVRVHRRITLYFPLADGPGKRLETHTFLPELLIGAVAVAVQPSGPFGDAAGRRVLDPLSGRELPVVGVADLETAAAFLVPAYSAADARRAQAAGIESRPPVYDDQGRVLLPSPAGPQTLDRRQAREEILRQLGPRATSEEGEWSVASQRCRRCKTLVLPSYSEQLFLHLERLAPALEQAIHSGAVSFHQEVWRDRTLQHLTTLEPLCISRQQWWGNALPGSTAEVLSTWFSLLAWSLTGAGWSASAPLTPVDEVYVNPELLLRWVVPSQLVALALTGRPAFRNIVVHGSVHLVDRALVPVPGVAASAADEERFVARTRLRPMRKQLGNVVEPATLVQRFGADALRLGLLLCLGEGDVDKVTLAEGSLRRARRLLHRLAAQVGGLQSLIGPENSAGSLSLTDQWLLERCAELSTSARKAYRNQALEAVGALLEKAVEALRAYGRLKARQRDQGGNVEGNVEGNVLGNVLGAALSSLSQGFSPVCPYVFAHLETWSHEKGLVQGAPSFEPWLAELVRRLQTSSPGPLRLAAADAASLRRLQGALAELEALCGRKVTLEDEPAPAGIFRISTAESRGEAVA